MELASGESPQMPPSTVKISLRAGMQELTIRGRAVPDLPPRLTQIGGFHVDLNIGTRQPTLIVLTNRDVPGVIGRVGTILGNAGVNIAEYHQARLAEGGEALAAIAVDGAAHRELRQRLLEVPEVQSATVVSFRDA